MRVGQVRIGEEDWLIADRDGEPVTLDLIPYDSPVAVATAMRPATWAFDEHALAELRERLHEAAPVDLSEAEFLPPVRRPEKIICVGLNYADHAGETGATVGAEPVIFNKLPSTLIGHGQPIVLPPVSSQVDYEAELVVVIGKRGKNIPRETALSYVAGYCCGNDVSARDWQTGKPGRQWLLGKSFDTFAPLGPWLVTADEIADPHNLAIRCHVNGETLQDSRTSNLIFRIDYLISYLSQICTLTPGDLLFTGTPSGVGLARQPQRFLAPGDAVEVEIEGVGTLRNPVTS